MLDTYKRECPRCSGRIEGQSVHCPVCRKLLPRRLSKTRRVVEDSLLGSLIAALVVGFLAPNLAHRTQAQELPQVVLQPWRGPGPEPAARAWAHRLENNLHSVCIDTHARYADRRVVLASLAQHLPRVTRVLGQPLTPDSLKFAADEEQEVLALLNDESRFVGNCLAWSYRAIAGCKHFKERLSSREASDCMVPAVRRALAFAPYAWCAEEAMHDRVRLTCAQARVLAAAMTQSR